jgi:hypothetical protein
MVDRWDADTQTWDYEEIEGQFTGFKWSNSFIITNE